MSFGEDIRSLVDSTRDPALAKAESWERVPFGEVATILNGYPWKSEYFDRTTGEALIRIRDVTTGKTETRYNGPIVDGFWVDPGDLIVGMDGDFNLRRWRSSRGLLNQRVCKLSTNSDVYLSEFLEYVLPSYLRLINDNTSSVTVKHLSSRTLAEVPLPLPPVAEQRRIVTKLDALTARLTRVREELDRAECLQRKVRLSVLSRTFAKYPNDLSDSLESLCRIGTGSTPRRGDPRYYSGGTIAWVTSGVVNQRFVGEPTEFITEAAIRDTNCKVFPAGSLLVALYGEGKTRGKVAKLGIAAATNQALAVLHSFEERVNPQWISLFLEARYQETRGEAAGGVQPNLNLGLIKAIRLPVPPLDEQGAAIVKTNLTFGRADRLETEAARMRALLDRLESAILAKALKGELVPQDPNDEPASVLLDRIRTQPASAKARHKPTSIRRITA